MSSTKKKTKFSRNQKIAIWAIVIPAVVVLVVALWLSNSNSNTVNLDHSDDNTINRYGDNATVTYNIYQAGEELVDFDSLEVVEANIVSAKKGFIRLKVMKEFLNKTLDEPINLKYKYDRYQPVLITFKNHVTGGPCIFIASQEYSNNVEICLKHNEMFYGIEDRDLAWGTDFSCTIYFNENFLWMADVTGKIEVLDYDSPGTVLIGFGPDFYIYKSLSGLSGNTEHAQSVELEALKRELTKE